MFTYTPQKASAAPTTKRAIFTCKKCRHTWAYDYKVSPGSGKFRKNEQGDYIRYMDDFLGGCPECGAIRIKGNVVEGRYSPDHICDGRCMSARGPNCECSCGGANHGKNYL